MEVKCSCGYKWDYKGKLAMPTCPSCHKNVRVKRVDKRI